MNIIKPTNKVPKPSREAVRTLIHENSPPNFDIPAWLENLVIVAYQNGRYDEACAETIAAALD